jgi:hypothetical protein
MKSLDSSNSRYPKLRNGVISLVYETLCLCAYFRISAFHISRFAFRHSCGEVFRHFNSRYPGLRNGVISWSAKLLLMCLFRILGFWISQLRDSCVEESQLLTSQSPGIRNSEMESDQHIPMFRISSFRHSCRELLP